MSVRILEIREVTKPIASPIRNAYIDFSKMTSSLVAVVTDVIRDGRRVVGYGFNSNGRYGQGGLIRERFANRIVEADPASLLDKSGSNLDPVRVWAAMMSNEKPGGHGERSVAVGTIDMAVWDATAKIAGKPLFRLLAERHGVTANPRVFVYAAGGYYYPGKDNSALRVDRRRPHPDRSGPEGNRIASAARRRCQRPLRSRYGNRLRQDAARLSAVLVRGSGRSARLSPASDAC
jgi:L-alanine-DL-glutamate epimerase-like enolase superfamily enzyme